VGNSKKDEEDKRKILKKIDILVRKNHYIEKKIQQSSNQNKKNLVDYKKKIIQEIDKLLNKYKNLNTSEKKDLIVENKSSNQPIFSKEINSYLPLKISDLEISTRTHNSLINAGINKIGDLVQKYERDLLRLPGFGQNGLKELKTIIESMGLSFALDGEEIQNFNETNDLQDKEYSKSLGQHNNELNNPNYFQKIEELNISVRSSNSLNNLNINYIGELIQKTEGELLREPNFGRNSLYELKNLLNSMNLDFARPGNSPSEFFPPDLIHQSTDNIEKKLINIFGPGVLEYKIKDLSFDEKEHIELVNFILKKLHKNITIKQFINFDYSPIVDDSPVNFEKNQSQINKILTRLILRRRSNKILVNRETNFSFIEDRILEDINNWLISLSTKESKIIKMRLGYENDIMTLEEIGTQFNVTRERIRQIEAKSIDKIKKFISFDLVNLNSFLKNNEDKGFNIIFPNLSSKFRQGKVRQKKRDISSNNLNYFLEKYCHVDENYFTTPDKTALDLINNIQMIKKLFKEMIFPISKEDLSKEISAELGIDFKVITQALDYLFQDEILVKVAGNKYYPYEISKKDEILSMLNKYPSGLHSREIFKKINSSPSKVQILNYHGYAVQGALNKTEEIMFCGKGSIKLTKFGNIDQIKVDKIFPLIIDCLKNNNELITLDFLYDYLKPKINNDIDIYDLRYAIKLYGEEYGTYFSGKSQARTISLGKPVRLNRSQEILSYMSETKLSKTIEQISSDLNISEGVVNYIVANLVREGKICRYARNNLSSNQHAYRNFKDETINIDISNIISLNNYVTIDFLTDKLNTKYYESKSKYFYLSYFFFLKAKFKFKINYHQDILSYQSIPNKKFSKILNQYINEDLDMNTNFNLVSRDLSISFHRFKIFFYNNYVYGRLD
tara:strand:+ start:9339 stop:12044 length:2706 start_codon:yes stop_codon:yes gene_type:complete